MYFGGSCVQESVIGTNSTVLLCLESEKSHKCPLSLSELFCLSFHEQNFTNSPQCCNVLRGGGIAGLRKFPKNPVIFFCQHSLFSDKVILQFSTERGKL